MSEPNPILRIGLPSGSLQEATLSLFAKAGFHINNSSRSYKPAVDDPELIVRLLRAQEISRYVEHGFLDCGLTGADWIEENHSDVEHLCELTFSKTSAQPTRWVLAVPEASPIQTVKDLQGKVIATEAVGLTRKFLEKHGVKAEVEFSWGATEVKVPDLVDAIVDVTETGSSLRANKLRIIETLKQMFPFPIAFSDHSTGWEMDIAALALGANMLEKTITEDRCTRSVEHIFSLEPDEASEFVKSIRGIETAFGNRRRILHADERQSRLKVRRSVYLKQDVRQGDRLTEELVEFRRPGIGMSPDRFESVVGQRFAKDLTADHLVLANDLLPAESSFR